MSPRRITVLALLMAQANTTHSCVPVTACDCNVTYTYMPIHLNMGIRCAGLCAEKDHVVHCCSDLNLYAQEIKS